MKVWGIYWIGYDGIEDVDLFDSKQKAIKVLWESFVEDHPELDEEDLSDLYDELLETLDIEDYGSIYAMTVH